jgi:hypothetical protein
MVTTGIRRRYILWLLAANGLFWVWFWAYFFTHATVVTTRPVQWEASVPWAVVLGRGLGNGSSLASVLGVPAVRAATILYLPCFILTWPISRWMPSAFYFGGIDCQGLRLLLITTLSFFQWILVVRLFTAIGKAIRRF